MNFTATQLAKATRSTIENAQKYVAELNEAMEKYEINTPERQALFLANVAIESGYLSTAEESLYYKDPAYLAKVFKSTFKTPEDAEPYVRNPAKLSEKVYHGLHGRGLIQTTGKANYEKAGKELGQDFIASPHSLSRPRNAALSAGFYWASNGCNKLADKWDVNGVTKAVNGPAMMHKDERAKLAEENLAWMGHVEAA